MSVDTGHFEDISHALQLCAEELETISAALLALPDRETLLVGLLTAAWMIRSNEIPNTHVVRGLVDVAALIVGLTTCEVSTLSGGKHDDQ